MRNTTTLLNISIFFIICLQECKVKYVTVLIFLFFFKYDLTAVHNLYNVSLCGTHWETQTRSVIQRRTRDRDRVSCNYGRTLSQFDG